MICTAGMTPTVSCCATEDGWVCTGRQRCERLASIPLNASATLVLEQGFTNVMQAEIDRAAQAITMDAPDHMCPNVEQPGTHDAAKGVADGTGNRARSNTNWASQGGNQSRPKENRHNGCQESVLVGFDGGQTSI